MVTLYALMHSPWWPFICGVCALAVLFALLRNINEQDKLPKPRMDCVARGPHHAFTVGPGHVRFDNQQGE
jgi:hypothetical protein